MRNDDLSQSGNHHPTANDDYDVIPAGSGGTANGNTITGRGTISGAAGADDAGVGGHVTAITGAGGGDGSSLEAAGRYGSIKIDAQGNYTYTRHHNSPDNVEDVFTYTLADRAGELASARLIVRIEGKEDQAKVQDDAQRIVAGNEVITLPAGVELSDIHVVGRDLVINLPDGTQMVITDGAVFVPQLALGDVEVPSDTLASLLIDSEPRPAAGPPQSSGGNFGEPVAPLDPGVPLGDLLPPTEYNYTPPTFEEIGNPVRPDTPPPPVDNIPIIEIQPDGQPAAIAATDEVDEAGLPARSGEPAGSDSVANSEVAGGNIVFTSVDGVQSISITINGTSYVVYGTGAVTDIPGDYGTLHINSVNIAGGTISYTYTLTDNVNHATDTTPWEDFSVTLVDSDGDPATATLRINILDDVPHANADVDSVSETGNTVADGNVFTGSGGSDANATDGVADVQGADGAHVTGVAFGGTPGTLGSVVHGTYGDLVLTSTGAYVYTLNADAPNVTALHAGQTVTDVFTYTITDGDGDTSTTTLTITVTGTNDAPVLVSGTTAVSEEGFVTGNPDDVGNPTDSASSASSSGNLSLSDSDGDALTVTLSAPAGSFTSHGLPITWALSDGGHTLTGSTTAGSVIVVTIDNSGHYTVDLLAQLDHPVAGTSPSTSEDILGLVVPVHANDGSVTVDGSLTVNVEDDSPIIDGRATPGVGVDIDESNSGTPVLSPSGAITVTSSGAVISAPVSYGGDGPGASSVYSITLNNADSGLLTADGDHPITLVEVDATHINGVFNDGADKVAFSITINANGSITVTQNYALEHGDDGNTPVAYNDTNSPLTLSGLITANVVYEDYDHDTVSGSAEIGQLIRFFDDGPSVHVTIQLPEGQALDGLALVTADDGTEGDGFTTDSTTANFGGAFGINAVGGADGLASSSLTFDLHLIGSGPVDSNLDSHGNSIYLYQIDANTVIGSTSATLAGATDAANLVFQLQTTDVGAVTLTQYQQIDHSLAGDPSPSGAPFSDQSAILGSGLIELVGTGTATDNDGDYANESQALDLGGLVRFVDDGPAISVSLQQGASLHIDESVPGVDGPGETDAVGLGQVTVALSALLNINDTSVSADGPTTYGYALLLGPAVGGLVDSGLMTSDGDHEIYLYNVGGTIVGSTALTAGAVVAGNTVFTVAVSGGNVVMTQYQAIEHSNTASFDENSSPLASGSLLLQVTATDFDGDTDTKSVDLGSVITFGDDGPNAADHVVPGSQPEGANVVIDVTADIDGGSDGLDHVEIVSKTGTGMLTYDAITHQFTYVPAAGESGSVSFVYRVFDKDGDHDDATVSFNLDADSKPTVTVQDLTVDEKGLPLGTGELADPAPNTDNSEMASGTMTISTGNDTLGAVEVQDKDGNWVDVTGATVGTPVLVQGSHGVLSVTSDGAGHYSYTYTLTAPYVHPDFDPNDGDGIRGAADPINGDNFAVRVSDNEGDMTTVTPATTINVTVLDDAPVISGAVNNAGAVTLDESATSSIASTISLAGITKGDDPDVGGSGAIAKTVGSASIVTPTVTYGADGPHAAPSLNYALSIQNATSGLKVTDGSSINLVMNGDVLVGVVSGGTFNGQAAFAIAIDPATGILTVEQYLSMQHPDTTNPDDPVSMLSGHIGVTVTATDGDNDHVSANLVDISTKVTFEDDGPSVSGSVNANGAVVLDESATSSVASTITLSIAKGDDPDVGGAGAIAKAVGGAAIVSAVPVYGADGQGAALSYFLSIQNATSGLKVTDGSAINLVMDGNTIVGVVSGGGFSGQAAFAIAIDPATGVLTVEQYLSLQHPDATNPDDPVSMLAGHIAVTVTATDGDGDHASTAAIDISNRITFEDDGPSIGAAVNANGAVVLDESATSSIASTITLAGITKGDDPDVGGTGAIAKAVGGAAIVSATPVYGADGQGAALSYALSIQNGTSGLKVTDGSAINLVMNGNTIVGVVSGGSFNGQAAFAIAIDPATGVLTVEQYLSIQHPDTTNPDDPVSMLAGHIGVTVTATDGDGDHASSAVVDISTRVTFEDDGPSISGSINNAGAVVLDESATSSVASTITLAGITKGDDPDVGGSGAIAKAVGGAAIVSATPVYGADGQGAALSYALSIQNGTSGLKVTDGSAINLVMNGNTIVGVVSGGSFNGQAAFAIAIDPATGVLTVEQYLSLQHPDTTNPDDPVSMLAGHIAVTVTATDGDGDHASTSAIDISTKITFEDDGPSIGGSANAGGIVTLDESATSSIASTITLSGGLVKGDDPNVTGTGAIAKSVGGAAIVSAVPVYGADGPHANPSLNYALSIQNATSGLKVTDGSAITLQMNGNTIVGVVNGGTFNGQVAFAIAIDPATGVATVEQYLSLQHPNASDPDDSINMLAGHIGVTVTATDGDNDTASTGVIDISTQIRFEDDGPSVSGSVNTGGNVALDETALSSIASTITLTGGAVKGDDPDVTGSGAIAKTVGAASILNLSALYGSDGQGPNPTYALSIQNAVSGLKVTDGSSITLSMNNGNIIGTVSGGTFNGQVAFAIAIDSSGVVTVEQYLSLQHPNTSNNDETIFMTAGHIGVTATVTDGDGDTATTGVVDISANITFDDDGPTTFTPQAAVTTNNAAGIFVGALDFGDAAGLTNNYGSDGGKAVFTLTGLPSTQTSGGVPLYYTLSNGDQTLTATAGNGGPVVYTATISGSSYTLDIVHPIDSLTTVDFVNGAYDHPGGNPDFYGFYIAGDNNSSDLLLTAASGGTTVNLNSNLFGIGAGNSMDPGDSVRLDFVTDLTPTGSSNGQWTYDGHYNTNGATVGIAKAGDATAKFTAYDDPDGNNTVGDGVKDTINQVSIKYGAGSITVVPTTTNTSYVVGGHTFWVLLNADGSVSVGGLTGNATGSVQSTVGIYTASGYNSLVVAYENGAHGSDTFKIGGFGAAIQNTDPVVFDIPVKIVDGDGDSVAGTPIHVTLNAAAPPVILDTNHDGQIGFLGIDHGVMYDMNGDGHLDHTAWAAPGDSILFFDADHNGTVSGANEFIFGNGDLTDLAALHAMYGAQLDANDANFTMFALWNDANSNGIVDAGEVQTLAEAGITSINLVTNGVNTSEAGGDVGVSGTGTYHYVNDNGDVVDGKLADASLGYRAGTSSTEQRIEANAASSSLLAIAAAAAALTDSAAAAPAQVDDGHRAPHAEVNTTPSVQVVTTPDDEGAQQTPPLAANDHDSVVEAAPPAQHNAVVAEESNIVIDTGAHADAAPQALPQGDGGPSVDMTPLVDVAPLTVMAEAAPANSVEVGNAQHNAVIGSGVVIEQPDAAVDQLLAKIAGNPAIESLSQVQSGAKAVQGWDMGDFAHLPAGVMEHMGAEASLLHPDAVQPVMHG